MPEQARAAERLRALAEKAGVRMDFPPEALRAVSPDTDDPALTDLRGLPFITIDNDDSMDLDQAMYIERLPQAGFRVFYALADASHFVRPGGALYEEAKKRGVTYYMPGTAYPMLPRALSEGVVSLNPAVDRRALVMVIDLDAAGVVQQSGYDSDYTRGQTGRVRLDRAVIHSRDKLSYRGVQDFYDAPEASPLAGQAYTETLRLLAEVGALRIEEAARRGVVHIHRAEVWFDVDPQGEFRITARERYGSERYNEQISLLCNSEGARFMAEAGKAPHITPIYKVHPEPERARVEHLRALIQALVAHHGLDPALWAWRSEERLSDYLAKLPLEGPQSGLTAAIHQQAVMINRRSDFSAEPGLHHGVGVDPYARFSSPMRELVGIFTHKEAIEKLDGSPAPGWPSAAAEEQAEMVQLANAANTRQKRLAKAAFRLVLDQIFERELAQPEAERPVHQATLLGFKDNKAYARLQEPPVEVKIYLPDLAERMGTALSVDDSRAFAVSRDKARLPDLVLGDRLRLRLHAHNPKLNRYTFVPLGA